MKPLLAATLDDVSALVFPVIASPKLDGIRCLIVKGSALSRTLKPIRNPTVQEYFKGWACCPLDGELICGEHDEQVFNRTSSCVMSGDGDDSWTYWVFDILTEEGYAERLRTLRTLKDGLGAKVKLVPTKLCMNAEQLLEFEAECLARGFEGVMVRDPNGKYKHGRSTVKEGILLKLKRFTDAEAEVIGFEERMHNGNEHVGEGITKRSTKKDGLTPAGDLGALVCKTLGPDGVVFNIGTGFTAAQRQEIWANRESYLAKLVTFKHFEQGAKDAPRFPVFKGWRSEEDL